MSFASTILHRRAPQHRAFARSQALRFAAARRRRSASMSRWTRSTIAPARRPRCTTSMIRYKRPRQVLAWRSGWRQGPTWASTSEVYGDPNVHPQTEEYWGHVNPIGLRSCYDEGKRCAETLFFDYWRSTGAHQGGADLQYLRFRACTRRWGGWYRTSLSRRCFLGATSPVYGDGTQTRAFCYVDDLVDGLIRS